MDRLEVFKEELSYIKNPKIREFTEKALLILPEYFFSIPASSTGKYHPSYSLGNGGLVRHCRSAVRIAMELFRFHTIQPKHNDGNYYTSDEMEMVISSLTLHDGAKNGTKGSKYTVTEHPLVVADLIRNNKEVMDCVDIETANIILSCIETHMSEWNKDYRTGKEVLPLPTTHIQKFVALCDYLASRKCLEMLFDIPISE